MDQAATEVRVSRVSLIDYVLAHGVIHLVHDDHGHEFWRLLGKVMPDYEARRTELRRVGARFEW
jgi:predicted metal-dependent hydrolase